MPEDKLQQPNTGQPQNDKPPATPAKEAEIHVIPPEFYGAAGKIKIPKHKKQRKKSEKPPAATTTPAVPPLPGAPASAQIQKPKSKGKAWLLIPFIALIFLALLGAGTWFLLKPATTKDTKPETGSPAVTLPNRSEETEDVAKSEPEPEPEEVVQPEPEPAPEPEEKQQPLNIDSDDDGLTDVEEALYGTDNTKSDSDNDGFSDVLEVENLYNPAGFKPTKLIDAGLVKLFTSVEGGYEMLFPSPWKKNEKAGGEVVFTNPEGEPVAVSIEENTDDQSALDWYLSTTPSVSPVQVKQFSTKAGIEGVRSPDGLNSYIVAGGKIYIITYSPGLKDTLQFSATYKMMVNSFSPNP